MSDEYIAKTFKSGNSIALRLPKGLGIKEGLEMKVREERGRFIVEPVNAPKRKIKGDWIGSMPWLEPIKPEDRVFDHTPRPWDAPDWPEFKADEP